MITLIILSFVAAVSTKPLLSTNSLAITPSASYHGKDGKLANFEFIKEPVVTDYQDESAPSRIQPRTSFTMDYTKMNETELYENKTSTIFEVIPLDYLCDFCVAVINKLKYRQQVEKDFEQNMRDECWKYNGTTADDGNVCELINKVALQRLQNDNATKICADEKLCADIEKQRKEEDGRQQKEREEEERKKQEEREKKKNEEIENKKLEATRLEFEKRKQQEAEQRAQQRRIKHPNSETGEDDYVIDEVAKQEDDKNDYLDHSAERPDNTSHQINQNSTISSSPKVVGSSSALKNSNTSNKSTNSLKVTLSLNPTSKFKSDTIILAPGQISGVANISPAGRLYVDRTVELKMDVEDLRRR